MFALRASCTYRSRRTRFSSLMSSYVLEDKRVVVTGAGMGLGAAYAEAAAAAGAIVLVNDVDLGLAAATVKRINAVGGRAAAFAADVSDWDGAGAVVDHCVREFGAI